MDHIVIVSLGILGLLAAGGCWLIWQLLRQNGRILLRLDELEKRLDETEFDESDGPINGAPNSDERSNRFGQRSLARSKIKRDGLKAGTPAPGFQLPRLDGGDLSLEELRGRRVLLVFSDPQCGPCNVLAPELEKFHRTNSEICVVMISRGEPKENRAKAKEHSLTFAIVLQQRWEISRLYAMFATPIGYLIDEGGIIERDVVVGVELILALMCQSNGITRAAMRPPLL